jgi:hypothetical protein
MVRLYMSGRCSRLLFSFPRFAWEPAVIVVAAPASWYAQQSQDYYEVLSTDCGAIMTAC